MTPLALLLYVTSRMTAIEARLGPGFVVRMSPAGAVEVVAPDGHLVASAYVPGRCDLAVDEVWKVVALLEASTCA